MKVIERKILGKAQDQNLCEDRIIVTDDFIAVIDGATAKGDWTIDGMAPGRYIGDVIEDAFKTAPADATAEEFLGTVTNNIRQVYNQHGMLEHMETAPWDRMICVAAIYSKKRRELWQVGDVAIRVNGVTTANRIKLEEVTANARSLYIQAHMAAGGKEEDFLEKDTAREVILPLLKNQIFLSNLKEDHDLRYGTINGQDIPEDLINVTKLGDDVDEVIIASDGYPKVYDTLEETENELARILKADPLCYKENKQPKGLKPELNSYDDRAYIRFKI
tara:strand:+ start:1690 stop:2517 length:828 start_codon:yes stop_codon:yes gene_type:complete